MTVLDTITIRRTTSDDAEALRRLADLDTQHLPRDEFLIAEVSGEPRAAIGLASGALVADPFHRTAELAELLRRHAERVRGSVRRRPARWQLRHRLAV